jgi:proline dehydrogenase
VIGAVLRDPSLAGWEGFGLAVQAYQKRAGAVIDWVQAAAEGLGRRMMVRLAKGAYWDTEVKRAQERGLADYPVFTRKAMDRPVLHGVRRKAARRAAGALSAVRHAQCADGGERRRAGRRRRGL